MKIILSCGGTGGHIYPALAIADEIRAHHPEAQILFIGTHRALENEVIPAHGYDIMNISASGPISSVLSRSDGSLISTVLIL